MIVLANIEIDEKGILTQIEKTRKAQLKFNDELYELEKILRKANIKEKRDSEEPLKD